MQRIIAAAAFGAGYAIALYYHAFVPLELSPPGEPPHTAEYMYWFLGTGLLAGGSLYISLRYYLVAPTAVAMGLLLFSFYDHFSSAMESFTPLYLAFWPFFVVVIALLLGVEYAVR